MRPRRLLRIAAIAGINLVIFYFLVRWYSENVHTATLAREFRQLPVAAIGSTIALNLLAMAFYARRLGVLIGERPAVSFQVVALGFGLNSVLPFRLGEVAKLYYARRMFGLPPSRLLVATFVEKFFDLGALAILAAALTAFADTGLLGRSVAAALAALVVALYIAVLGFRRFGHVVEGWLARLPHFRALLYSLREQSRIRHVGAVLRNTVAIWLLNIAIVKLGMALLLPATEITWPDAIALLLITALSIAIPSAPAGVGIFEAGIVAYLVQWKGIGNEAALVAALAFHFAVSVPQVLLMLASMILARFGPRPAAPAAD